MTNTTYTGAVSPGTLVVLFADRFAPKSDKLGMLTGEYESVGGVKVKTHDLGHAICVAALFTLRERGVISLSVESKKFLGLIPTKAVVTRLLKQEECSGVDAMLVQKIAAAKKEYTVKKAVVDMFGGEAYFPAANCVTIGLEEAAEKGYVTFPADKRNGIAKMMSGTPKAEPVAEKLAELQGEAEAFRQRFEAFKTAESELYHQLIAEVKGAFALLNAASKSSSDSSGMDYNY